MEAKERCPRHRSSSVRVIPVIEVRTTTGDGTPANPCREVVEYWSIEGELMFAKDALNSLSAG